MARNHLATVIWHAPAITNLRHSSSLNRILRYVSARRRRLPNYIIAGAQKSGTTSLWAYLSEHPNVDPPITKEVNFFDRNYHRGMNWYRLHFPLARATEPAQAPGTKTLTGEATPNYMFDRLARERIVRALPNVKVILLMRNPVERAFSHYQHKQKRRQETRSFEEAIDGETERLERDDEQICANPEYYGRMDDRYTYVARGLYFDQILGWQACFPSDQLLSIESGTLFERTHEAFERVCEFLGLPPWQPAEFGNRYPGKYREKMLDATRRRLVEYFVPHNEHLYAHLGTRFDWDR